MTAPAIGETVYISGGAYGRIDVRTGTVEKVSPTGVVRVITQSGYHYSFQPDGRERGGDRYHPRRLISKAAYDELASEQQERLRAAKATSLVRDLQNMRMDADKKPELLAQVEKVRQAIERL